MTGAFSPADNTISVDGLTNRYINFWASGVFGWTNGAGASDTGLSRGAADQVDVGNGTAGDASGTIDAANGSFTSQVTLGAGAGICGSVGALQAGCLGAVQSSNSTDVVPTASQSALYANNTSECTQAAGGWAVVNGTGSKVCSAANLSMAPTGTIAASFASAPAGSKFVQTSGAGGLLAEVSLSQDKVTGAAAQATATEAAAGDNYTFSGVETGNLTSYITVLDANSTNNNTNIGFLAGATGSSTGEIGEVVFDVSGTGDIVRWYSGGSVSNGVYTPGTLEAHLSATGLMTLVGGVTAGGGISLSGASGAATTISTTTTNASLILAPNGTGAVVVPTGSASQAGVVFNGDTTSGFGRVGAANSNNFGFTNGSKFFTKITAGGDIRVENSMGFAFSSSGTDATASAQGCLSSLSTNSYELSTACGDSGTVTATSLQGMGATGSNVAAANFVLAPGLSTGSATVTYIQLKGAPAGNASGSTQPTPVDRGRFGPVKTLSTTNTTATTVMSVTETTLQMTGGELVYTIEITDGTDVCDSSSSINWSLVNKGGTYTGGTSSPISPATAFSSGTACTALTATWAWSTNNLQITPTWAGTITPTTVRMTYTVLNHGEVNVAPQ